VGQLKGEFTRENMYRPGSVMVLADSKRRAFLLEVYCLDYAKNAVRKGGVLNLALIDKRVARILNPPAGIEPTLGATQIAIWMDRAGITAEQARRRFHRTTTEVDVQVANQSLVHAEKTGVESIPNDMPASVKVHVTKLFSPNPEIRAAAAEAIGALGVDASSAVSFLTENVLDRSTDKPLPASVVRVDVDAALGTAVAALERLDMPSLTPLIDSLRERGNGEMVEEVARAAQGLAGDIVLDGLIGRLTSHRAILRQRAARLLGQSGNQRAIEPLIDLLGDENEQVQDAAVEALKTLTGKDFGLDAQQWRQWLKDR
jgi:hypothetical protein